MADQHAAEAKSDATEPRLVAGATGDGRVVVVSETGMAVEGPPRQGGREERGDIAAVAEGGRAVESPAEEATPGPTSVTEMVEQPAKVMRIGHMIGKLLEEVKAAPLDEASRIRLREIYLASVEELKEGLDDELGVELQRLASPFSADATPSDAELRIAQAQLVGWLEGLFQGIQTALFAQQMAARSQLEQMRRALPQGGDPSGPAQRPEQGGMYL